MKQPNLVKAFKRGLEAYQNGSKAFTLVMDKTAEKQRNNSVLHVSDLKHTMDLCPRQLFLKLHNAEKQEVEYNRKLMFSQGDINHLLAAQFIEYGLDDYWTITGIEESVKGLGLIGRYDMSIRGKQGETYIVDFKSSRGGNFKYLDNRGASERDVLQVQGYLAITKYDAGILFYIDREGQNGVRQFAVNYNSLIYDDIRTRVEELQIHATNKAKTLEPSLKVRENKGDNSIYLKSDWRCGYCDYYGVSCEGDMSAEMREISGIVAKQNEEGIYAYKEKYETLLPLIRRLYNE